MAIPRLAPIHQAAPEASPRRRPRSLSAVLGTVVSHAVLLAVTTIVALPFFWMLTTSLKSQADVYMFPPIWIPTSLHFENYQTAWNSAPFGRFFFNSFFVTTSIVLLQLTTASLAAYVFARLRLPGRDLLFLVYLGVMMIPGQVTFIPVYILLKNLGWIDTYAGLIMPFVASGFGTFLLRQTFLSVPEDLSDAALIDGASHLQILRWIMLPLSRPAIATFALLSFIWRWNDYFWPLIVTNSKMMRTVPVGLVMMRATEGGIQWHVLMAGALMGLAPVLVLFLLAQRQLVQGIARTGLKG
jgi:ABC-type glycerol-3-phosphate transport system permease component